MTVKELIKQLEQLPDLEVYLSIDEEGNGFGRLVDVQPSKVSLNYGEITVAHPDEYEEYDNLQDAVVLWP